MKLSDLERVKKLSARLGDIKDAHAELSRSNGDVLASVNIDTDQIETYVQIRVDVLMIFLERSAGVIEAELRELGVEV